MPFHFLASAILAFLCTGDAFLAGICLYFILQSKISLSVSLYICVCAYCFVEIKFAASAGFNMHLIQLTFSW